MRIAYVCEGGGRIGWGHVGRGRALAEAAGGAATIVLGAGHDEIARWCVEHEVPLPLARWETAGEPFATDAAGWDLVMVDHYTLDPAWIEELYRRVPVVVVDDWMRREVTAAGLVNANVGASPEDYPHARVDQWLLGPAYAPLRAEVRSASGGPIREGQAESLLVTLGGSDPEGRTAEIVNGLAEREWFRNGGRLTVVLGPSYAGERPWEGWPSSRTRALDVVRQPRDFVGRVARADVVVCGASTTTYELAYLGRPFAPVALVDNQAHVASAWAALGVGAGVAVWEADWCSRLMAAVEHLLADAGARRRVQSVVRAQVDGRGTDRLLAACRALARGRAA